MIFGEDWSSICYGKYPLLIMNENSLSLGIRLGNDSWGIDIISILDSISQVLQISI